MNVALNMLTFNGEALIERSLRSILPFIREAHVIDTGSSDGTMGILTKLQLEFPYLEAEQFNVQHLGATWVDQKKNEALTGLLNKLKIKTKAHWILKADDDEIFPEETMLEITNTEKTFIAYSIPFLHFEKDCLLDPSKHRDLLVARLFKNNEDMWWKGDYGTEVISRLGHKISSKKCPRLRYPFLHLGEYRTGSWKHDYRFHKKGHCGLPIPDNYKKYLPD
jgi:glycosyltransferase involved in cell wall biosynthesis